MKKPLISLPVLPLKNTLIYPALSSVITVGRTASLAAVHAAIHKDQRLIVVAQRDSEQQYPGRGNLFEVGTRVNIKRVQHIEQGVQVILEGEERAVLMDEVESTAAFLRLAYRPLPNLKAEESLPDSDRIEALLLENMELARQLASLYDATNGEQIFNQLVATIADPVTRMYRVASLANIDVSLQQEVLEAHSVLQLTETLHRILKHDINVMELQREIADETRQEIDREQREHILRKQKRVIEHALGEEDGPGEELAELKKRLEQAGLPEVAQKEVERELRRLGRQSPDAADFQVVRSYLELVAELPWAQRTNDVLDIGRAEAVLEEDHYGLVDIKERILESLAVMQLNPQAKAPIICFVGPPGVGKTSLGQSIARAIGRKFERLSLGGMHDEAELRGHRRTYIGALPGRILQALRRAGVNNPLLMLDEVDKLGRDFRGDPAAALMEILDPAQNQSFMDNYLNLPFDLSRVFFITTANSLDGIPRPLLDRMEVMTLSGYDQQEKLQIARRYLIPRQVQQAGLTEAQFDCTEEALATIIRRFTREAGVRELERVIGQLARKRARQVLQHASTADIPALDSQHVIEMLGPEKFRAEQLRTSLPPGVAAGLAWTEAGGDILYVEATCAPKDEKVTLTGQLGPVMQESARAARSFIWSDAAALGIDRQSIEKHGVHIHVPAGAVPKDGPSAGVTMATALVSCYSNVPVRSDIAMTGELTLTGLVLPVGGIKEKILAAHRNGIRHVILPRDNETDLARLPANVAADMEFTWVQTLREAIAVAIPQLSSQSHPQSHPQRSQQGRAPRIERAGSR